MPTARFQPSFAAGVLGPGLHGRIDIAKYDIGLKVGKNVFVRPHGGVSNRAGTQFICEVMDSNVEHRLIPFGRDDDANYVLLFGDQKLKIIYRGSIVSDQGQEYVVESPYTSKQIKNADYVQSIDVMYFAQGDHPPKVLSRKGVIDWGFRNLKINPTIQFPVIKDVTPDVAGTKSYYYKVSAVSNGVESLPSLYNGTTKARDLSIEGSRNTIEVFLTSGIGEYRVYRNRGGEFGYIGYTVTNTFIDDNIDPDITNSPVQEAKIFSNVGNYPKAVAFYQQRLVFANSTNFPETMWFSRIGDYENFTRSRYLRDDERIELSLKGQKLNSIRQMVQLRELLVFTADGEFSVTGPNGVLLASNPIQRQNGYSGSTSLKAITVGDTILFVDGAGQSVRDLRYAIAQDGYSGNNLTIFASHFFEGKKIVSWAYCMSPHSIVWAALSDGTLLSFTYEREHEVWAWCEHDVGGKVESLTSVREGTEDFLYLIVNRTINGKLKRYVERMASRVAYPSEGSYFVDCGLSYSGVPKANFSGLDHLEGQQVVALCDGNVVENLKVVNGSVALPRSGSVVHIGLPYISEIETLPPAIELQDLGNTHGRKHNIARVHIQLEKSRGIEAAGGAGFQPLVLTGGDLAKSIEPYTGMQTFSLPPAWQDGTVRIRQKYPLPFTILGINAEIVVGR